MVFIYRLKRIYVIPSAQEKISYHIIALCFPKNLCYYKLYIFINIHFITTLIMQLKKYFTDIRYCVKKQLFLCTIYFKLKT